MSVHTFGCCVFVIYVEGSIPNEWFCKYLIKPNIQWCEINTNSKPQAYEDECFVTENANTQTHTVTENISATETTCNLYCSIIMIKSTKIECSRIYVTVQILPFNSKLCAIIFVFLHEWKKISLVFALLLVVVVVIASAQKRCTHKTLSIHLIPEKLMWYSQDCMWNGKENRRALENLKEARANSQERKTKNTNITWNTHYTNQRNVDNYAKTFEINIIRISCQLNNVCFA